MTTKEYLSQISRLNRVIENKIVEISQLKDLCYGVKGLSSTDERVQTSPDLDKIGSAYAKIDELERNLDEEIDNYLKKKNTIIAQIDSMKDETLYMVLFARYIEKKTFEVIATELHYSFRQITRLHGKALREFEKEYGKLYLDE